MNENDYKKYLKNTKKRTLTTDLNFFIDRYNDIYFNGALSKCKVLFERKHSSSSRAIYQKEELFAEIERFSNHIKVTIPDNFLSLSYKVFLYIFNQIALCIYIVSSTDSLNSVDFNSLYSAIYRTQPPKRLMCVIKKPPGNPMISSNKQSASSEDGLFVFDSNNCYLDVILTIIYKTDHFRNIVLGTDTSKCKYSPSAMCSVKSKLYKPRHILSVAKTLTSVLIDSFCSLSISKDVVSKDINEVLALCDPGMSGNSFYNSSDVYTLFCNFYPALLMNTPYRVVKRQNGNKKIKESYYKRATIGFWDYLGENKINENIDIHSDINWGKINDEILVFQNTGHPNIHIYNVIGREKEYTKIRKFGETILNGKYRIFAAVMLSGVPKTNQTHTKNPLHFFGSHYTLYIQEDGIFYHYNDQGPRYDFVGKMFPTSVFRRMEGSYPEMYFYKKVRIS